MFFYGLISQFFLNLNSIVSFFYSIFKLLTYKTLVSLLLLTLITFTILFISLFYLFDLKVYHNGIGNFFVVGLSVTWIWVSESERLNSDRYIILFTKCNHPHPILAIYNLVIYSRSTADIHKCILWKILLYINTCCVVETQSR